MNGGDQLGVELADDEIVLLSRHPERIVDAFAGRFTHLFPSRTTPGASWRKSGRAGAKRTTE